MHKSKLFALITICSVSSLAVVSYAATTTYFDMSSVEISVPAQPISTIAPAGALHVPFTKFNLTARGSDVVISRITVVRVGPADDAAFEEIVLLDGNGDELAAESLNDEHVVEFTEPLHIAQDTTLYVTVAANMADDLVAFDGQTSRLVVTDIEASGYATAQ